MTSDMTTTTSLSSISLMPHQQQIHDFLVDNPFAGAWLGVGAGKTLTTLRVLQTVRPMGHILVIAPVAIARSTWIDEIEKWGFPIRTKSLIVNDNDKKLSKKKRLERFREVFTDPPTMYFVNQELLTQPSQGTRLITPAPSTAAGPAISPEAAEILDLVQARGPLSRDELITEYRDLVTSNPGNPIPAKSKIHIWIQELFRSALVTREVHDCRTCAGAGCAECRLGLVDQMPVQDINGQKTIIWPFQTVIIDESQGFKSHGSQRFKALKQVRPAMKRLIELTGTPSPNGLHDLWSQVYLLDEGRALGQNITVFRDRWFVPKMVPGTTTPAKWIPTANAEAEIHQAISHLVMSAQNTSLQLPALTIQDVNVTLPPDLLQAYKEFKRDLVLDVVRTYTDDDGKLMQSVESIIAENQAVLTSKLMQFASGTLYTADPDDPATKGRYQVIHDKKIEMTEYLARNSGGEPVLIAYHFKSDKEQLLTRLRKAGFDAQGFDGSRDMVRRWNAKQIPVMLLHPAAAGHGLNLQHGGSTLIWYTLPFSLEHYLQTNGRLYRTGQTKPVTIHRLIAKGTQDERMPSVLAGKQQVQDDLIEAVSGDFVAEQALLAALEEEIREDLNDLWASERV
ncbi:SNF2-related protein [Streptomyces sp. NPDC058409]|uniref:SNF2-related protein n=1 Tax=Streptomyces sp. NPDC058409 TaxID=3346484 RepID=UPI00364C8ED6